MTWYAKNKERHIANVDAWREKNKDKVKEYHRRYREKHREKLKERINNWNKKNREKTREIQKRYRERHREKIKLKQKKSRIKNKYKHCEGSVEELLKEHKGLCDSCGEQTNKICVDHCHNSLVIRGLLCNNCNVGIGFFKDDIIKLHKAIKYLEKHEATKAAQKSKTN